MATPVLTDAEHFDFTTLAGERLDLFGALLGWSDDIKTGVVEKLIVKRSGAIHQTVGAPPRRMDCQCSIIGPDVRARYNRIVDAIVAEPEGLLTHPRFGARRAVCESINSSESPGEAVDVINFTLHFSETGLRDPPKPAPSAQAATASTQGTAAATASASSSAAIAAKGQEVAARSAGFLVAMQSAEGGLGTLLDVDASLSSLAISVADLDTLGAPKAARTAAMLALSYALKARNRFAEGRPPLIRYQIKSIASLGALCQSLYGSRGRDEKATILRLNRIARPFALSTGTTLLLTDPSFKVVSTT